MTATRTIILAMIVLAIPQFSRAQVRQFFGGGVSAYTPEISVVNTGVLNDVQATVSPDRKYVTLGMQPANSQLLALHEFSFANQQAPAGFVGGAQVNNPKNPAGAFGALNQAVVLAPGAGAAVLAQRGMTPIKISP